MQVYHEKKNVYSSRIRTHDRVDTNQLLRLLCYLRACKSYSICIISHLQADVVRPAQDPQRPPQRSKTSCPGRRPQAGCGGALQPDWELETDCQCSFKLTSKFGWPWCSHCQFSCRRALNTHEGGHSGPATGTGTGITAQPVPCKLHWQYKYPSH